MILRDLRRRIVVLVEIEPLGIAVDLVRLLQRLSVDVDLAVADLDGLPRKPDHPLDVVLLRLLGKFEHDDVAALHVAHRQQRLLDAREKTERGHRRVGELVHHDVVADQKRRDHRAGRDLRLLEGERAGEQDEDDARDDRLEVVAGNSLGRVVRQHPVSLVGAGIIRGRAGSGNTGDPRPLRPMGTHSIQMETRWSSS